MSTFSILKAIKDPKVFGQHFRTQTWKPWFAFLAALFGLPMTAEQFAIYTKHTGRTTPPIVAVHRGLLICGRRAGKSFILALIAVFLAISKIGVPFLDRAKSAPS